MSKNFELLKKLEKLEDVFPAPSIASAPAAKTAAPASPAPVPPAVGRPSAPRYLTGGKLDLEKMAREEISRLANRLFLIAGEEAPTVVAFTAVGPSAGSTAICAQVAQTVALRSERRVCLVDANLRAPSLHLELGVQNFAGLTDSLFTQDPVGELARCVAGTKLWVLPSGMRALDPLAMSTLPRTAERFAELRGEFDHVLVSVPPVDRWPEALEFCRLADGTVMVLDSSSTRRRAAERAKEDLESAGIKLLGAVLNNRTFPIPQLLYERFC